LRLAARTSHATHVVTPPGLTSLLDATSLEFTMPEDDGKNIRDDDPREG
jgi:hypothetical protein